MQSWHPVKTKISTLLAATARDTDKEIINQWSRVAARVLLVGPLEPDKAYGVRVLNQNRMTPIRNIIGAYMFQVPAGEVVLIGHPDVAISAEPVALFDHVNSSRLGLAWAAHIDRKYFVMSASVLAHIMMEIPQTLSLDDPKWTGWFHEWFKKTMMPPRYFDASNMGVISRSLPHSIAPEPKSPVLNAYDLPVVENVPESKETAQTKKSWWKMKKQEAAAKK